ncbi:hypothetical protein [Bacillus benzoevorans]|uniref:Uncharacterized protein n=1 Tax=Bacillus benzoevorans TaxID=1456 RepID=A0A7X0LXX2_9BACI|nr:hypothetical protein [Bacillus benzoevorans]MBB6446922.1 hypothetical protein [Bacillus benzoevorans]
MKFVKWIVVPIVLLIVLGFGIYQFGLNFAIEKVSKELESSGKMDEVREMVKNDPELEKLIKEVETTPEFQQMFANQSGQSAAGDNNAKVPEMDNLPFDTKEEAIEEVVDRIGMPKLYDMYDRVQAGTASKEEIIAEVSNEFSQDEMTALKIIAYQELYGSQQN